MIRSGALLLAAALAASPAAGFTLALSFESGRPGARAVGPDAFDEVLSDDAEAATYSDARAAEGRQSARVPISRSEDGWGGWRLLPEPVRAGDSLWARMRVYAPAGFDWHAEPWLKFPFRFRTYHGPGLREREDHYIGPYLNNPNGSRGDVWRVENEVAAGGPVNLDCRAGPRHDPREEVWETYEVQIVADARASDRGGRGHFRMWKDGVLVCDLATQTLPDADAHIGLFGFGTYWNETRGPAPRRDQALFVDDGVITNETPRGRDAAGTPMIGVR